MTSPVRATVQPHASTPSASPTTFRPPHPGRPWALTGVWILVMAVASIAGRLLQAPLGVDDRVLPLVMVGPAVGWLVCRLAFPSWFPSRPAGTELVKLGRAWLATVLASGAFAVTLMLLVPRGEMVVPELSSPWLSVGAVVVGLTFGCWCEEIGFRGVMYRALCARYRAFPAIMINGIFFGLCHIQYFADGPLPVLFFLAFTVLLDVAVVLVWQGDWTQRVLMITVLHTVTNIALQLWGATATSLTDYVHWAAAMLASTIVALVAGRALRIGDFFRDADRAMAAHG